MFDSAQILREALSPGRFDALQDSGALGAQAAGATTVEQGEAMGFRLETMSDPMQELQDSMEELSFQFEEKAMKTLGERKLGEKPRTRSPLVEAIKRWQALMPDMPGGAFAERMLRNLRLAAQQGVLMNASSLLRMLGEASTDPSHQFAILDGLEEALGADEKEIAKLLTDAKRQLNETKGPEIRAGINLAAQINAHAKTPEEMRDLRDLYRSEVIGFKGPQDCFRSLMSSHGIGKLGEALDFLLKGCGIDLQSPSPSQSPEELRRIISDLQCVQVLKTVMDQMGELAGKMQTQFGETCLLNGEKLAGRIIDFTEMPFINAGNIAALVSSCGLSQLLAKLYFCTELIGAFRLLSPRLFADESSRFQLVDAAQEHLDGLVALQEEAEQNGEEGGAA